MSGAERFFAVTNTLALLAWLVLVLLPGRRGVSHVLCAVVVPGGLAAAYAAIVAWKLVTAPPAGDLMTIAGLRQAFGDDWVFAAAWTHYLVFDMVVGAWIARRAARLAPLLSAQPGVAEVIGPGEVLAHLSNAERDGQPAWSLLYYGLWHSRHVLGLDPNGDVESVLRNAAAG